MRNSGRLHGSGPQSCESWQGLQTQRSIANQGSISASSDSFRRLRRPPLPGTSVGYVVVEALTLQHSTGPTGSRLIYSATCDRTPPNCAVGARPADGNLPPRTRNRGGAVRSTAFAILMFSMCVQCLTVSCFLPSSLSAATPSYGRARKGNKSRITVFPAPVGGAR
jgi:hypothetical protein